MYPTKEEILSALPSTDIDKFLEKLRFWKHAYYRSQWKTMSNEQKNMRLMLLCYQLYTIEHNRQLIVHTGEQYCFYPDINTIIIQEDRPSVLSTLHEIGHAVWGDSELDACRFSVKLFMTIFPEIYKTLEWDGHMLRKKWLLMQNASPSWLQKVHKQ